MNIETFIQLLTVAMVIQILSIATVQKIKDFAFINKRWMVQLSSIFVNFSLGVLFCFSFTNYSLPSSFWIGFFSWLGADTIYKSLEEKGFLKGLSETLFKQEDTSIEEENSDYFVG